MNELETILCNLSMVNHVNIKKMADVNNTACDIKNTVENI